MKQTIIVNAGVMVRDNRDRLLMRQYKHEGIWEIPCCEMQEGLELERTMIHEFEELTYLQVSDSHLYCIFSGEMMQFRCLDGYEFEMVLFVYEADIDSEVLAGRMAEDRETLLCSDENVIYRFVNLLELELESCSTVQRPLLDQLVRKYQQEVLIR